MSTLTAALVGVVFTLLAPSLAQAQFICGISTTGGEAQSGGAGTTVAGGAGNVNFACGQTANASSGTTDGGNMAIGFLANAHGNAIPLVAGASNTAIGNADAFGDGSRNWASGFGATAKGNLSDNTALGSIADAHGNGINSFAANTALGRGTTATGDDNKATAVGAFAHATGVNASAFGANAHADQNNTAAFGNGATTTRENQQMFGTTTNTYTMAGITSGASKMAQVGSTQIVTSDLGGNLATATAGQMGLATSGDVSNLQSQINRLGRRDEKLTEGIAAIASVAQPILLPGQHFAMRAGWGGYDDANAVGFSAAGVVASGLLNQGRGTVTLDGGVGFGTSEGEVAGRAGATFGW